MLELFGIELKTQLMKKLFISIMIIATILVTQDDLFAQPGKINAFGKKHKLHKHMHQSFFYYPSVNVYYSPSMGNYWYMNSSNVWINVNTLPTQIVIINQPRHEVFYDGLEVWRANSAHFKRYKNPKKVLIVNNVPTKSTTINVDIRARF